MREILDPHPVTRLLPPVLTVASGACGLGCALAAFRGGTLPFFGIEVEGGVVTGLLWLLVLAPLFCAIVYFASLHLMMRLDPWLSGTLAPAVRRRRKTNRPLRVALAVTDRLAFAGQGLLHRVVTAAEAIRSVVVRAARSRPGVRSPRTSGEPRSRSRPSLPLVVEAVCADPVASTSSAEEKKILDRAEAEVEEMEKRLNAILQRLRGAEDDSRPERHGEDPRPPHS